MHSRMIALTLVAAGLAYGCAAKDPAQTGKYQPAQGQLMTDFAKDVSVKNAHPEYPRPQMVREDWRNLNGLWEYAITAKDASRPAEYEGKILVPFPIESALSGVMKRVDENQRLWYRRTFEMPGKWQGQRVLIHFGAVDWDASVIVNDKVIGGHKGGYDGFTFDITDALKPTGPQEIVVSVWDPSSAGPQPRGKQVKNPGGIWYTPTTGIWQTVWIEPVPQAYIAGLKITPDVDNGQVKITVDAKGGQNVAFEASSGKLKSEAGAKANELIIKVPNAKLWSPDSPHLYDLKVRMVQGDKAVDEVESYFGMRKIAIGRDEAGVMRILLNNKFVFHMGFLDQGFWPDGLYTAPTDEALRYDIEMTKKLGMNMARKHVKVEPARWYYWCDKLGLLVWQDMPSGDAHVAPNRGEIRKNQEAAQQFEAELKALIDGRYNHPSIVMWVVFNEGWGQYDTIRLTNWTKQYDPSRLANCASGWNDFPVGDVHDIHSYPGPSAPKILENRSIVLGEFGGLGLAVKEHMWQKENWGYRVISSPERLTRAYIQLLQKTHDLKTNAGLSAAVYTQTTDVETETNGLMTYDRKVVKPDLEKVAAANRGEKFDLPQFADVLVTSQEEPQTWRYTFQKPADNWFKPEFDASAWKEGKGGFGTRNTPGSAVRTEWNTPEIWIRRDVDMPTTAKPEKLALLMHHDEDAEVYINGVLAAKVAGFTTSYEDVEMTPEGRKALKPGKNVIAVHCRQTGGGQYIDLGLVEMK